MADKQIIVEIQYDTDEAQKNIDSLALKVDGLKESNKKYNDLVKQARKDLKKTDDQLKEEGKTRENIAKTIRNSTVAMSRNKDEIKQTSKARTQAIKEITGEKSAFDKLTENIQENTKSQKANTKALDEMPGATGGFISGVKGMINSAKAFIATPLGAILAIIVGVLGALKKAFGRSEDSSNKLKAATAALSGIFNGLMKILEPVAKFLADKIGKAFEFVGKVADKAMGAISKGLKFLGFDKAAASVDKFTESIKESTKAATDLAKAEAELVKQQRWARKIQLDFQKDAEKLRQIRDDEARSINERIKANEELGNVLQKQLSEEMKIANQALKVAELRIQLEGDTTENLDARAEALTQISDIQERILGQESEQLVNINSLKREQLQLDKEQAAEKEKAAKAEEDRIKKQTAADEKAAEEKAKLQEKELEQRATAIQKMAEIEYNRVLNEANTIEEIKKLQTQKADEELRAKLENEEISFEEIQALKDELSEEELEIELERRGILYEEYELAEMEHKNRLVEIDAEYNAKIEEHRERNLQSAYESMQNIIAATRGMADSRVTILSDAFSKISTINFKELESSKDKFMAIAQAASGLTSLITAGHEKEMVDLENQKAFELSLVGDNQEAQDAINKKYAKKAADLKTQQAKDDKNAALIDATIATALGVVSALANSGNPILGIVMAALVGVLGGVQIAAIAAQPTPTFKAAKGGVIGGKPHSQGGTKFTGDDGSMFEAEKGEAMFVLKKDATAEIAALSMINESHGGRSFFGRSANHLAEGGPAAGVDIQNAVQEELQRTPIFVRTGDIETGMTDYNNVKNAGVI